MNNRNYGLTIVVPTLNEEDNVELLTNRISTSMNNAGIDYHILFIDDHSEDKTVPNIMRLSRSHPVSVMLKAGKPGKAYSILEGIKHSDTELICMIDADLQYPPEEIPVMVKLLVDNNADVVLSSRIDNETSLLRRVVSKGYNLVFTRLLFGIHYDTQSGLKVFRKQVFHNMRLNPSPWSFDLEFIVECLRRDYRILTHDIAFGTRHSGEPKINVMTASIEIAKASVKLRAKIPGGIIKDAYRRNARFNSAVSETL